MDENRKEYKVNRKDCKWMEIVEGYYSGHDKCLCNLTPYTKKVEVRKDCINCKNYVKKEADE